MLRVKIYTCSVRAPVSHPMIRGENISSPAIMSEVLLHCLHHLHHPPVHEVDVVSVLLTVGLVNMTIGVTAQQVQEHHVAILSQFQLQCCVVLG